MLNGLLSTQIFLCGDAAGQADAMVYSCLMDKLPMSPANVVRWVQHMAAFSCKQLQDLLQLNTNNLPSSGDTQVT